MKKCLYPFLFLLLVVGAFYAGIRLGEQRAMKPTTSLSEGRSAGVEGQSEVKGSEDLSGLPPGTVHVSSAKQQAIGVRVGLVERKPLVHTLRVLGRVALDDNRVHRMTAAAEGWIREVFPLTVGSFVRKGQALATCYSRELVTFGQTYLSALTLLDRFPDVGKGEPPSQHILPKATPPRVTVNLAEDGLRSLGMGEGQIEEMRRTRQLVPYIVLVSPADGFVVARNAFPSQWFDRGTELYRIADLSHVWVFADLYENEENHLRPGTMTKLTIPQQKRTVSARVSDVLPQFDPITRTLKLRLEAENPDYLMRPDMFVDVELPLHLPPAIRIPADAVLDSGRRKIVFVDRGNGFFEPREVETGSRIGNRLEIVKGLKPGERIVLSGNFLIDSESKFELVAEGMQTQTARDLVSGTEVSIRMAEKYGRKSEYQGNLYYFSSDESKKRFDQNPRLYVKP